MEIVDFTNYLAYITRFKYGFLQEGAVSHSVQCRSRVDLVYEANLSFPRKHPDVALISIDTHFYRPVLLQGCLSCNHSLVISSIWLFCENIKPHSSVHPPHLNAHTNNASLRRQTSQGNKEHRIQRRSSVIKFTCIFCELKIRVQTATPYVSEYGWCLLNYSI